jgi:hypothetical protein
LINELIERGADLDHKNLKGTTPILESIEKKSIKAVEVIINA